MIGFQTSAMTAIAIGLAGCMLSPTDDGHVANTLVQLPFGGFTTEPSAPVQVRAWNYTTHAMANVGGPVMSTSVPTSVSGGPLYQWTAPRGLPSPFWRTGPGGGQCAAVGALATVSSGTYNVMTVESDWGACFNDHPSVGDFFASCASSNSPVAKIYTNNWGAITVDQSRLDLAGLVASGQITLTFDNYTPTLGQFCNTANLAGCPQGVAFTDPVVFANTYQFFAPRASSLTQTGQPPLTFSITPTRVGPFTGYIDNMSSSALGFTTAGTRFVLGITFETAQPEIQLNCIDNALCGFTGNPAVELSSPRATISFALQVQAGRVVYTDAIATFTTSSTDTNVVAAASGISAAMTDMVNNEPSIKSAVASALDAVIRQTAGLGTFPLDGLSIGGGVVQVRPGCPLD